MNPYSFVLPEAFHPGDFLRTPELIPHWDDARYLVSLILTKMAHRDLDRRGLAILHAKFLNSVMHKDSYRRVIDALLEGGVVERFAYKVGDRSFGYRLGRRFISGKHIRVLATDPRIIRRLERRSAQYSAELESRMLPVHHALAKLQTRLQIHGDEARSTLEHVVQTSKYRHKDSPEWVRMCQSILIDHIEQRQFHINVGEYFRMTNNITSLHRRIRPQLHVSGERLISLDLSCSQPALIASLIADSRAAERSEDQSTDDDHDQQLTIYDSEKKRPFSCELERKGRRWGNTSVSAAS